MHSPHPAIAVYKNTADQSFDLIMIVGREPNSTNEVRSIGVGPYDFDTEAGKTCAFWNTSYGTAARAIGKESAQLKQACRALGGSPIIYADALPITIPTNVGNKSQLRRAVADDEVRAHVDEVFSDEHQRLLRRVKLVLLSGLSGLDFDRSRSAYQNACSSRGVLCASVPFFYGTNSPQIAIDLQGVPQEQLTTIVKSFWRGMRFVWQPTDLKLA